MSHPQLLSTVFAKGQTVIPKRLREHLHIGEGDLIQWEERKDGLVVRRVEVRPASEGEELSKEEWEKLDRWVVRQRQTKQTTIYEDVEKAKHHFRHLMKRTYL
ncbi:MAG: AbrB/MazE/SpoVT family DNA-binding domain-containing protein [Elusimicrobia bacterium]|nr:AbrB/MazE/SpoVT family DNA-binding domain-containing protein [Elusimicrobiota bacterium]